MSRYYSYNDFMSDVFTRADATCHTRHGSSLSEYANVSESVIESIMAGAFSGLAGWFILPIVAPLPLGASMVGGMVMGAIRAMRRKQRSNEEVLCEVVRKMSLRFKSRWEALDGYKAGIDTLVDEAAEYLLKEMRSY